MKGLIQYNYSCSQLWPNMTRWCCANCQTLDTRSTHSTGCDPAFTCTPYEAAEILNDDNTVIRHPCKTIFYFVRSHQRGATQWRILPFWCDGHWSISRVVNSNGRKSCAFSVHAELSNQLVVADLHRIRKCECVCERPKIDETCSRRR